jgi:hypothetical protein
LPPVIAMTLNAFDIDASVPIAVFDDPNAKTC